ncbi:hypothetical protein CC85DRAFT_292084 [Cutaneotrichosporon oleaginosum]|uniref:Uncharacterized protein n=1 Tax=Cutaneotrichosporon oleaginosum TaxID=879819 RepID=A0A0J0XMX6_9TREE|nr:uncharacterized protein CC85DRAFT_292084 [Cutaneotrichosporon oleaginosum]KLT42442.1 hypothetical protein CC85DRAFT_292084 [Cutaneotrichosporon oleaginosum]TXT06961.1 hypothetical protein COLE_06292 [Cutaneotrichosporon oleaginosum]
MRLLFWPLALFAVAAAQSSAPASSAAPASTPAAGDDGFTAPPEQDMTLPWNITYFIVPTRNNYWVNDAVNSAKWTPVNVATNLMLSNSNASIAGQRVVLAQNIAPGTSTWTGKIQGYNPGNNYMLQLTAAGNPDQKFAQSQGFWIKPNGTAMPQQVAGVPPSTPIDPANPGAPVPNADGSMPTDAPVPGAAPSAPYVPGLTSAASALSAAGALVLAAAGLSIWL